jgi:hypothetical protein
MNGMPTTADAAAMQGAVACFVERALSDPLLVPHWVGIDPVRLRRYARGFLLQALGGPEMTAGDAEARRAAGIDDPAFDRIVALATQCLREGGVSADIVELTRQRIEQMRSVIVTV